MEPTEVKVLHDRGTHFLVLPKRLPIGAEVEIGPPRNVKARVTAHDFEGVTQVEVLPEYLPRRIYYNHDWLPESFHGEFGPLVGASAS